MSHEMVTHAEASVSHGKVVAVQVGGASSSRCVPT